MKGGNKMLAIGLVLLALGISVLYEFFKKGG
jgi:hypothetical protein